MDDLQLLGLAAKACCYEILRIYTDDRGLLVDPSPDEVCFRWNPLVDDGDALRLAVKLGLQIFPDDMRNKTVALVQDNDDKVVCAENYTTDPLSATRRAIVRAAAEIGKAIP